MLTDADIKKLTKYLLVVFKDVFVTREEYSSDIGEIKNSLSVLQSSLDSVAKDVRILKDEMLVANYRIKNLENWVDLASPKLGLEFKH